MSDDPTNTAPTIQYFITPAGWGVTFSCGWQSSEELLRAFPLLRTVRDNFERGRPLPVAGQHTAIEMKPG